MNPYHVIFNTKNAYSLIGVRIRIGITLAVSAGKIGVACLVCGTITGILKTGSELACGNSNLKNLGIKVESGSRNSASGIMECFLGFVELGCGSRFFWDTTKTGNKTKEIKNRRFIGLDTPLKIQKVQ